MQQAELMGFLRTLLIILIVYYSFRFLARIFAPLLLKKVVGNMQAKAKKHHQQKNQQSENSSTKEGETIIDKNPNSKTQGNNSVGEYVDFEEID
ncbi:DUF4834 family protein [bacterium]|jgi:hypothetical protein|nr:DUF4834 family protein [bacterium]MDA9772923.1 DUF4834 family protein [Flavobacteriaceae bacterium]MDB4064585.1 DUF4834 family protein [Flavobacteriaceae bacterium]MDB9781253.1 DUF4834 family protein [Flavobacteriaceae bacterium]MDB9893222.1 DUF4834 family protein [Flavobacteriaceae bacterium]|tara:strand:+ start:298 stop:579 length:282 start_codon:yes stop_codon:yes gene_type:complete